VVVLTCSQVDCFTWWPEAIPLAETSALTCAHALIAHWIARFGVPAHLSSDRGTQFASDLWSAVAQLLGIQLHRTTAYHPQSKWVNGTFSPTHEGSTAGTAYRPSGPDCVDGLPWVLLGIRTAPKEDIKSSSAELVFGAPLRVSGDFLATPSGREYSTMILQELREKVGKLAPVPTTCHGGSRTFVPPRCRTASLSSSDATPTASRFNDHMRGRSRSLNTATKCSNLTSAVVKRSSQWTGLNRHISTWIIQYLWRCHHNLAGHERVCQLGQHLYLHLQSVLSQTFACQLILRQAEKFVVRLVSSNFVTYSARGVV